MALICWAKSRAASPLASKGPRLPSTPKGELLSRSLATRPSRVFPAMIAELIPPIEVPMTQWGRRWASPCFVDTRLVDPESAARVCALNIQH